MAGRLPGIPDLRGRPARDEGWRAGSGGDDRDVVPGDVPITGHEGQAAEPGLPHQHAIERIAVVQGQVRSCLHVGYVDAEKFVVAGNGPIEVVRNVELADGGLDRALP